MMPMTKMLIAAGVTVGSLFAMGGTTALAAPLLPGGVQFPALAEPDPIGASLVFTTGPVAATAPTFAGTLTSSVYNNDATNPFGPNALTFTYLVSNAAGSDHAISRLSVSDFSGFLTDVSYVPTIGAVSPTLINRSLDGEVIGAGFVAPSILAGQAGSLLVVQTNATSYQPTLAALINGSSVSVASLAPIAIPEPATAALALGVGFLATRRRVK